MKNAKLKNMFKLSSKVTIYVPSTMDVNEPIDTSKQVDETARMLSACFGGATSTKALGYWVSPEAGLVKELSTMVFAYCTSEQLEQFADLIVEHCEYLKSTLYQDAIALEINGEMYFI